MRAVLGPRGCHEPYKCQHEPNNARRSILGQPQDSKINLAGDHLKILLVENGL